MTKKVLIFTPSAYPALQYGGPIMSMHRNGLALSKEKFDVHVFTTTTGQTFDTSQIINYSSNYKIEYVRVGKRLKSSMQYYRALPKKLLIADHVIIEDFYWIVTLVIMLLSSMIRKKCFIVPRGSTMKQCIVPRSSKKKKIFNFIFQLICKCTLAKPTFIYSSEFERVSSESFSNFDSVIIPNRGSRQVNFNYNREPRRANPMMLFVGRISTEKDLLSTLLVFERVRLTFPELILNIIGPDFGELENLKRLCDSRKLCNVYFCGQKSGKDLSEYYLQADILILTSRFESFGNVILEALNHGCPVVTNDKNPWADLNEFGAGAQVPHSIDLLASAATTILQNGKEHYEGKILGLLQKYQDHNINDVWKETLDEKRS